MSSKVRIFDASVFLAILKNESYPEEILDIIEGSVMGAVNYAEVITKLHEFGLRDDPRVEALFKLLDRIEPFNISVARITGDLRPVTRSLGLSLGDRACLALGIQSGGEVYTAEHKWAELDLPCAIHLIR